MREVADKIDDDDERFPTPIFLLQRERDGISLYSKTAIEQSLRNSMLQTVIRVSAEPARDYDLLDRYMLPYPGKSSTRRPGTAGLGTFDDFSSSLGRIGLPAAPEWREHTPLPPSRGGAREHERMAVHEGDSLYADVAV